MVSFGRSGPPRFRLPGWMRDRRLAVGAGLVVVAAAVAVAIAARGHSQPQPRRSQPEPRRSQPQGQRNGQVTVIHLGHGLLGVRARWELFAAGPGVLWRIGLAAGVITRTTVPELLSTGPVSFIVGPRQAVIRPLDFVPGYLVSDGQPTRRLPASLGRAGMAFPGPRPDLLWVQTRFGQHDVMSLVTFAGRHAGESIAFPGPSVYLAVPDGRGYFLVQNGAAVYDFRPGRRWRVASGTLDAAGPSAWLITRCSNGMCRYQVVDPASGARRLVPGRAALPAAATPPGVTSPDGLVAALVRDGPGHRPLVQLINLVTGADRATRISIGEPYGTSALAWSPDSRWLFAVTAKGSVVAIDPATGRSSSLGVTLPPVTQLAIRAS